MAKRIQVKQQNGTMKDIDLIATHDENGDRIIDTYCKSNDPRLSDARTPTAHTHNVSEIDGVLLPAGGVAGDILVKQSSTDGDVAWQVLVEVGATGQTLPSGKLAIGGIFFMEVD